VASSNVCQSLAPCFVSHAILVLDEATSALDPEVSGPGVERLLQLRRDGLVKVAGR
jgi:ABC-type polar amino acid transport system ATPase subunit